MPKDKNSLFDEDDLSLDEFEEYEEVKVIKRCHCGHKGELVPDHNGYKCANCDYLLVDNSRSRKQKGR